MKDILKSLLVWAMIIPLAILNGGLRDHLLTPWLGEAASRPVSAVILSVLILLLSVFVLPRFAKRHLVAIGIVWVISTVIFETALGLAIGKTLGQLASAYNPAMGDWWLLVVITTGIAPWLGSKIGRNKERNRAAFTLNLNP
jgi:hypothetical protein